MKGVIQIALLSEATFGRGDGIPGVVDSETEHDEQGFPILRGRSLKGLLAEEGRNLLFVLGSSRDIAVVWHNNVFGVGAGGSGLGTQGALSLSDATLPWRVRQEIGKLKCPAHQVLAALTDIRRQTSIDCQTEAPAKGSLRSQRVILRGLTLEANMELGHGIEEGSEECIWFSACAAALRRAGAGRNRGRGRIRLTVCNDRFMHEQIQRFEELIAQCKHF